MVMYWVWGLIERMKRSECSPFPSLYLLVVFTSALSLRILPSSWPFVRDWICLSAPFCTRQEVNLCISVIWEALLGKRGKFINWNKLLSIKLKLECPLMMRFSLVLALIWLAFGLEKYRGSPRFADAHVCIFKAPWSQRACWRIVGSLDLITTKNQSNQS